MTWTIQLLGIPMTMETPIWRDSEVMSLLPLCQWAAELVVGCLNEKYLICLLLITPRLRRDENLCRFCCSFLKCHLCLQKKLISLHFLVALAFLYPKNQPGIWELGRPGAVLTHLDPSGDGPWGVHGRWWSFVCQLQLPSTSCTRRLSSSKAWKIGPRAIFWGFRCRSWGDFSIRGLQYQDIGDHWGIGTEGWPILAVSAPKQDRCKAQQAQKGLKSGRMMVTFDLIWHA